jgi:hypothetical protein
MATHTSYHPGGYLPDAPAKNVSEEWSHETETYTSWDENGAVVETRPLTEDERQMVAPSEAD